MNGQIPMSVLKLVREKSGISQTALASELKVSGSVVSRLESSEYTDPKMAARYLAAIGTELANEVMDFYSQSWLNTERPLFVHPERGVLWQAEQAIQKLQNFEKSKKFDPILQDPVNSLRARIVAATDFIRHREHGIAFIGEIGVGKTTGLSFVTGLVYTDKAGKRQSVFPTGSGRTTVCEVAIKIAPTYGIAVDSLNEEEIRALVADLVGGIRTAKSGLSSELERVLRNMADLRRVAPRAKLGQEKPKPVDPLKDMVDATEDIDQVISEVISRMRLESRTETQLILSENAEGSTEWLADNVAKINYGQHPSFSVPQRITVLLPLHALRETPYLLSVIDTKGVEGTTQRPDLKAQLDDPRTVIVLCSKFSDAPGTTPLSILREVVDSGSDAIDSERLCLLVLPREDEALKIVDDTGGTPSSVEEGYGVREAQIEQQFATEALPTIPVNFFNVGSDDPEEAWNWLTSMIEKVRKNKVERVERLLQATEDLIANSDAAKTRQARITIAQTISKSVDRFRDLPAVIRPAHQNLLAETKKTHQSSIAASVARKGKWENFSVNHILGVGVRADANLRTRDNFVRIDEQIEGLKAKYAHVLDVKQFLESMQEDLAEWKQEFLTRAALAGRVSYAPYLENATALWKECSARYGDGAGYRVDLTEIFQEHFETDADAIAAHQRVEAALSKIWEDLIIERLKAEAAYTEEEIS